MASSFTSSKGFEKPAAGDYNGTWAPPLNGNWDIVEKALSGVIPFTLGSTTVALTLSDCQNAHIALNGTLTANVTVTVPFGVAGHWIVGNYTSGAFTVSMKTVGSSFTIVLQQGRATLVWSDGANVALANSADVTAATYAGGLFASTNQSMFAQGLNAWIVQSPTGQTNVAVGFKYNGGTLGGYVLADSDGMHFLNTSFGSTLTVNNAGDVIAARSLLDSKGDVRSIPPNARTSAYVLTGTDVGEHISITTGGVTVPSGIFSAGQAISVYNDSATAQTITQGSGATLRLANTETTGDRTLAGRGLATIFCVKANEFVVTGVS